MKLATRALSATRVSQVCVALALSATPVALIGCRRALPTIAVIPRTCGTLLWEAEHTGIQRTASGYGLSVYWNAPMRDDDVQGQIEILTHVIDHGAKGLIISPVEALPLCIPIHRALMAGTPVVVVGTDLGSDCVGSFRLIRWMLPAQTCYGIVIRTIWPLPAGAAPQLETYRFPSGPKVIPVGTERPVATSSMSPVRLSRTTLPRPGVG